jgi:hypothetical protein
MGHAQIYLNLRKSIVMRGCYALLPSRRRQISKPLACPAQLLYKIKGSRVELNSPGGK